MSLDCIYNQFYASSNINKGEFFEYWKEIARLYYVDAGKLRPNDCFDIELAPVKGQEFLDEIEDIITFCDTVSNEKGINYE